MTHVLGNKRRTCTIASIGLLLAVTGCTAAESDAGASLSASPSASSSSSEAAPPTSSETTSPTAVPPSAPPSAVPSSSPVQASAAPSAAPSPGDTPSPSSPSASASASPSAAPVPTASPSESTPAAGGICTAAQLTGAVEDQLGGGAAGSVYRTLLLTNASDQPCTLEGYPGVSFVDLAGTQVGAPAERDGSALSTVILAPGASAASTLRQTNAQNYGPECSLIAAAGIRVYPPGATDSLFLPQEIAVCAAESISLMSVGTMQATS